MVFGNVCRFIRHRVDQFNGIRHHAYQFLALCCSCFALILLQFALLRKRFSRLNWLQLPLAFVFSAFLDFWMFALSALPLTSSYWISLLFSMFGNAIFGLGIVLEIRSKSVPLSGEAFVLALSIVSHKPFPSMKIANDISLVCLACTLLSALTVGLFVKVFSGLLEKRSKSD